MSPEGFDAMCRIYHDQITTKSVYSRDNMVYIKIEKREDVEEAEEEIWYPVNFQWAPVILKNRLINGAYEGL